MWKAADEVFGIMSRISDPSEEIILGYKAVEEDLLVIQNLDAATRRLGLDNRSWSLGTSTFASRGGLTALVTASMLRSG